jgi:hypothetical protein
MERIRLAFEGHPVAGISSILDALVLLLSTILMGHWPTIADPYSSVVGQKGMFALLQLVYALVYTQEIQEEAVFFSHEPGSTSGAVVCILFHICWSFLIYQSGWQLQVILSCCCPICGGFDSLLPVSIGCWCGKLKHRWSFETKHDCGLLQTIPNRGAQ